MKLTSTQQTILEGVGQELSRNVAAFNEELAIFINKGHKSAGVRARTFLLAVKKSAHDARKTITEIKNDDPFTK